VLFLYAANPTHKKLIVFLQYILKGGLFGPRPTFGNRSLRNRPVKNFMIVDDSSVIRKVARQILEATGFACTEAENGRTALDQCETALPECILLDWNMPVMNGLDFVRALRQMPDGQKPVVVFCTKENDMQHIREAMDAGANEYIMKPFDADVIRSKLEQLGIIET
jgi:two-component system, chemotaxis family, chemotaxis protein CheY